MIQKLKILSQKAHHFGMDGQITKEWDFTKNDMVGIINYFKNNQVRPYVYDNHVQDFSARRPTIGEVQDLELIEENDKCFIVASVYTDDSIKGYPSPELAYNVIDGVKQNYRIKGLAIVDIPAFENVDEINKEHNELIACFSAIEENDNLPIMEKKMDKNVKELFTAFLAGDVEAKAQLVEALKDDEAIDELLTQLALAAKPTEDEVVPPAEPTEPTEPVEPKEDEEPTEPEDEEEVADFSAFDYATIDAYVKGKNAQSVTVESLSAVRDSIRSGKKINECLGMLKLVGEPSDTSTETADFSGIDYNSILSEIKKATGRD